MRRLLTAAVCGLVLAASAAPPAAAQTSVLWRTYVEGASTVETAPDGSVTVAGATGITRLSPEGAVVWSVPRPSGDAPLDLAVGPDGEVYVLAQVANPAPTRIDILVYRINADGTLAWSQSYDGPTTGDTISEEWDQPKAILVTSTGTVVTMAVSALDSDAGQTVWTQGYAREGTLLWSRSFVRTGGELQSLRATGAAVDCAGNVFIIGHYTVINSPTRNDPGYLLSYASDGTERFTARLFGRADAAPGESSDVYLNEVAADCSTGAVYVAGQDSYNVANDGGGRDIDRDAFVARYDGAALTWQAFPFGPSSGTGNSSTEGIQNLAVSPSGEVYASAEAGDALDDRDRVEVARLHTDGSTAWLRSRTGTSARIKRPTVAGPDGVTVVTTEIASSGARDPHYVHYAPDGTLEWDITRSTTADGDPTDRLEGMAAHPGGGVVWLESVFQGPTHVVRAGPQNVTREDAPEAGLALALENPARGGVPVRFSLSTAGPARLVVLDVLGRDVAVLADGERAAGAHTVALSRQLAPGAYVLRLTSGRAALVQRIVVVR